ncbi:MAG: DUF4270 family protein [Paludibacteraceae bacterium]|nr:DUF4270 family protein [Paludibacteraceae bacterium]
MRYFLQKIGIFLLVVCAWTACKDDVASAGKGVLDNDDAIIVLVDTFPLTSMMDSCKAIISQADSFLLGEIETDYGLLRASVLTQLACPTGYSYPEGAKVDSICLFMYYSSWEGDKNAPLAINAYMMDKQTFDYSGTYPTDLNISDYCSRSKSILTDQRIVVASEKMDSIQNDNGDYIPMLRMRVNDDFEKTFWAMQKFESQDKFNQLFKGLLIESSFGSSTMLNITDIALGVYYNFSYKKRPTDEKDTVVHDMKAFYANAEVRTVNHLEYPDKKEWVERLQKDSDTYNYIIAPAGAYTRIVFPMARISDSIMEHMVEKIGGQTIQTKQPYVNKASVRIDVTNKYTGSEADKTRNEWLQPASYMLLIKEESMERFFANKELPTDTCALLSSLVQGTDSNGDAYYYYSYDMSDFLTNQLRKADTHTELKMVLVPVSVVISSNSSGMSVYSSVRQEQTMSATRIRSAKNGMQFEIVYSGFTLPSFTDD